MLLESGLDSLCFAIIVARLEDQLGVDPFTASEDVYFPVTMGDFIKFYQDAARVIQGLKRCAPPSTGSDAGADSGRGRA